MSYKISGFLNFHVSHLNYEKFNLYLQNTLNTLKTTRVYFGVLQLILCINGFYVHRVLVDPGSAADLLELPVFKQMKLSLNVVNSAGQILFGFNSVTTVTL